MSFSGFHSTFPEKYNSDIKVEIIKTAIMRSKLDLCRKYSVCYDQMFVSRYTELWPILKGVLSFKIVIAHLVFIMQQMNSGICKMAITLLERIELG